MDEFTDSELCRSMRLHKTRVNDEWQIFSRFGVLNFVEQNGCDQHWIDRVAVRFSLDHRFQPVQSRQGVGSERLELVHPTREQLSQLSLRSVDAKSALQMFEFFGTEIGRIRAALLRQG